MVEKLYKKKHITAKTADEAKIQFDDFLNTTVVQHQDQFMSFDYSKQRLYHFFLTFLHKNEKLKDLWGIMIFSFTLSHGQSEIERGFSVDKEIVVENLLLYVQKESPTTT